jgi:hypothetical protein
MGSLDPDPGGQKRPTKIEKVIKFHFWSAGGLKATPAVWNILKRDLEISKLQFLNKKIYILIWAILSQFLVIKPWVRIWNLIRIRIQWIRIHNTAYNYTYSSNCCSPVNIVTNHIGNGFSFRYRIHCYFYFVRTVLKYPSFRLPAQFKVKCRP